MRKRLFLCLLALLALVLCACASVGEPTPYNKEHEHLYGFWYESADGGRVRYCKICFAEQLE